MCLYMLLEILRALEGLSAEFTSMWFQRDVDSDVGGDVVALDDSDMAVAPCALQIEIVGALPPNVTVANMLLDAVLVFTVDVKPGTVAIWTYIEGFSAGCAIAAACPLTDKGIGRVRWQRLSLLRRCMLMIWVNRLGLRPCLWIVVHVLVFLSNAKTWYQSSFSKWISRR